MAINRKQMANRGFTSYNAGDHKNVDRQVMAYSVDTHSFGGKPKPVLILGRTKGGQPTGISLSRDCQEWLFDNLEWVETSRLDEDGMPMEDIEPAMVRIRTIPFTDQNGEQAWRWWLGDEDPPEQQAEINPFAD